MPINFNKASPCYKIKDHDDLKLPAEDFTSIAFFKIPYDDTEFNETRVRFEKDSIDAKNGDKDALNRLRESACDFLIASRKQK